MIKILPLQQNQVTFKSIKPVIRTGEQAIREFKAEFPVINSSSRLSVRMGNACYFHLNHRCTPRLEAIFRRQNETINEIRRELDKLPFKESVEKLSLLLKTKKTGNCDEMARLIQYNLLQKGIKTDVVECFIVPNKDAKKNYIRGINAHVLAVVNMPEKALYDKPKTWINKAVIVDAWTGECGSAHKMISRYKDFFNVDTENEHLEFVLANDIDVNEYLRNK